jgi:hydroxymethyl cephem carbamoyltransferase
MLIVSFKPAHDGAVAVLKDSQLLFSLESEKDTFLRHSALSPHRVLEIAERVGEFPDVVAMSGWTVAPSKIGTGYVGQEIADRPSRFFGKPVRYFASSHERSHLMMSIGMAPKDDFPLRAVLIWEGQLGGFYLMDGSWRVTRTIPVLSYPGARYSFLYGLADPTFPDYKAIHRIEDAGKLMALAAYGDPGKANPAVVATVERILEIPPPEPVPKGDFRDSPVYNAGVESEHTKHAAALLSDRIFEIYAAAAREHVPRDIPLHISGGCGLNCDWNAGWRDLGHFSSVFVPPCTDDSGSAIGTAIDALATYTGEPHIDWNVYSGLEFEHDLEPDPTDWERRDAHHDALVDALAEGEIVAWVQGRWEIGPRALGNRSILAEPFQARTRDRLNEMKQREPFRPIAPCCRIEDVDTFFTGGDFEDPYMLYFRNARTERLAAVTHVDGSARVQTVSAKSNPRLHSLLSVFARRTGAGVLCNTSLNYKGRGFINRMSHLVRYCKRVGIENMVVGDTWYTRVRTGAETARRPDPTSPAAWR